MGDILAQSGGGREWSDFFPDPFTDLSSLRRGSGRRRGCVSPKAVAI